MEIMLDGQLVTCTPAEYMELKRLGAFGDKPAEQGAAPKLGDGYDEWLTLGRKQVVAVYGCSKKSVLLVVNPESKARNDRRIKEHWRDYVPEKDERNKITREHRVYKHGLMVQGLLEE